MLDLAAVTAALVSQIETYLSDSDNTSFTYRVKRAQYLNHDPALTPWVGVYRSRIGYEPRAFGGPGGNWRTSPEIKIMVQASSRNTGAEAEDRLEDYIQEVMNAVLDDMTITGTVETVTDFEVGYSFKSDESETLFFHMGEITLRLMAHTTGIEAAAPSGPNWSLAGATYDSVSYNAGANLFGAEDIRFSSDGTKMYFGDSPQSAVLQYALSTAWDITTASYSKQADVSSGLTTVSGVCFSSDGLTMYVADDGVTPGRVAQFTLSTAWDVAGAAYASKAITLPAGVTPKTVYISSDGTKVYAAANTELWQWTLSSAGDLSTASLDFQGTLGAEGSPFSALNGGIFLTPNGDYAFIVGTSTVVRFVPTTAWDLSTIPVVSGRYDGDSSLDLGALVSGAEDWYGVHAKSDGAKLYVVNNFDSFVHQFSLT